MEIHNSFDEFRFYFQRSCGCLLGATSLFLLMCMSPAYSQEGMSVGSDVATETQNLEYHIINLSIADFLGMLVEDSSARIAMSDSLGGRLERTSFRGTLPEVLTQLSSSHNIDWFQFNGIYYVSTKADAITRLVPLNDLSLSQAMNALRNSGLSVDGMHIDTAGDETALAVYGAPEFIGIVEAIIEVTPGIGDAPTPDSSIVVRRGTDLSVEYLGQANKSVIAAQATPERDEITPDPQLNTSSEEETPNG